MLIEVGRRCGVGMNVEKNYGCENLKAPIPSEDYSRSKTSGECGIFKYLSTG
jgi:hypothetical protein